MSIHCVINLWLHVISKEFSHRGMMTYRKSKKQYFHLYTNIVYLYNTNPIDEGDTREGSCPFLRHQTALEVEAAHLLSLVPAGNAGEVHPFDCDEIVAAVAGAKGYETAVDSDSDSADGGVAAVDDETVVAAGEVGDRTASLDLEGASLHVKEEGQTRDLHLPYPSLRAGDPDPYW